MSPSVVLLLREVSLSEATEGVSPLLGQMGTIYTYPDFGIDGAHLSDLFPFPVFRVTPLLTSECKCSPRRGEKEKGL
ncbi:MAG: hypothetical protein COV70_00140 [Parcubacteria group bacterium CG11_big_fil_rev_8_21_14_0_20_39_22]|nr:MAG: hypothetical protein COV70_00140 [Parcubacteria group bacterium CG11_big_fil_rev_8_21_14_0_20_39_22]